MIVKDEGQFLEECLEAVKGLVDEMVIVDTGSTDNTREIALKFGAKVYDFEWCDDFSAARNESLKHASGDWILVLDADELIDEDGCRNIREAVENGGGVAYSLPQLHYTNKFTNHPDFLETKGGDFKGFYVVFVTRLFKRLDGVKFDYCVHETVRPSLGRKRLKWENLDAPLHHYQELKGLEDVEKKQEFYFRLSLKNIEKYPDYAKSYNDVAIYYGVYKKEEEKALRYARKAVELESNEASYLLNLGYRLRDLGRYEEAIRFLKSFLEKKEDERVFRALGYCYYCQKDYGLALEAYGRALDLGCSAVEEVKRNIEVIKRLKQQHSTHL